MKVKLFFLTLLLSVPACSLFYTPTATVKKYMSAAQKGDVDTMTNLFSKKAIERNGLEQIRANNQGFAEMHKRAWAHSAFKMENVEETSIPTGKRVSFLYKNLEGSDAVGLVFHLSKEKGTWKIDEIGGSELADAPDLKPPAEMQPPALPSPSLPAVPGPGTTTNPKSTTISGGVLNGKAISLPKPPYPPIAKSAKASGTVVVQVLVDESGNVTEAHPVSGHPLLQAAAVAAARQAKFTPTKLSGQPVKVKGVVTYNFVAEP